MTCGPGPHLHPPHPPPQTCCHGEQQLSCQCSGADNNSTGRRGRNGNSSVPPPFLCSCSAHRPVCVRAGVIWGLNFVWHEMQCSDHVCHRRPPPEPSPPLVLTLACPNTATPCFCGSNPIENVVCSRVRAAGRADMGVKVWVWLSFHVLLWSGACVLGCGTPLCCHEGGVAYVCNVCSVVRAAQEHGLVQTRRVSAFLPPEPEPGRC